LGSFISLAVICSIIFVWVNYVTETAFNQVNFDNDHPAQYGNYETTFFTYGSGTDLHREEFAHKVTEITDTVDASHFITQWSHNRRDFWGFQQESFPINGRVWMPEGEGEFPLI